MIASAVVVLPQPDSPASPSASPALERQVDAGDDRVAAVVDLQALDLEQRAHRSLPQPRVDVLLEQVAEQPDREHERR